MNNNQTDRLKSRRLKALAATIDEDQENPLPGTKEKGARKRIREISTSLPNARSLSIY